MTDCIVEDSKIKNYLLDINHPVGGGKAKFFLAGGFSPDEPALFAEALKRHLHEHHTAAKTSKTSLGARRLVIEGAMTMPDGRAPEVRTIWDIDPGQKSPRLITAYAVD